MAQHVIPAAQLVPQYKPIGRCNNYTVLQSIPCSPECKIVGLILLDHCLSHALTATADVPAVYLQQFWRTVSKVPDTEDTIKFMLDTQQFIYTVDMFRDTLHLPVETPENPFVAPANIHTIEAFMNRVGYKGVVDKVVAFFTKNLAQPWQTMFKGIFMNNVFQKKEAIQYPYFIKLIVVDLMKKLPNITKRLKEDYHCIKDDVPLFSVYTTGNVLVRGMLILDAFLTAEIRETDDFKEYETVFMKVDVLMNQPQLVVSTQGTHRITPSTHRSPTVSASSPETKKRKQTAGESSSRRITIKRKKQSTPSIPPPGDDRERDAIAKATLLSLTLHKTALLAEAQEKIAKVQEKLDEEEIDKLVDGDDDDKSSTSAFTDFVLNDDGDDTGSKLELGSHKEHPEHMFDDGEQENNEAIEKEKEVVEIVKETNVDDEMNKKDKEVEKEKEVVEIVKETNVDDTSAKKNEEDVTEKEVVDMLGSQEIRKEQMQTPIPSPIRSPRNDLSLDKTISEELVDTVTPTTATSSKTPSTTTRQKKSFTLKTRRLPGSIAGMCRQRGLIRSHIKTKFITREFFVDKIKEVIQHCDKIVPELTVTKTNEILKKEMPRLVKLAVNKDREISPVDISGMVSKEFAAHGPKLIEALFQKHMQNTTLNIYPKTKSSTATTSSANHLGQVDQYDGVLGKLKFVSKGEDEQMYGMLVLDVMMNDAIKNCDAYLLYIALSSKMSSTGGQWQTARVQRGEEVSRSRWALQLESSISLIEVEVGRRTQNWCKEYSYNRLSFKEAASDDESDETDTYKEEENLSKAANDASNRRTSPPRACKIIESNNIVQGQVKGVGSKLEKDDNQEKAAHEAKDDKEMKEAEHAVKEKTHDEENAKEQEKVVHEEGDTKMKDVEHEENEKIEKEKGDEDKIEEETAYDEHARFRHVQDEHTEEEHVADDQAGVIILKSQPEKSEAPPTSSSLILSSAEYVIRALSSRLMMQQLRLMRSCEEHPIPFRSIAVEMEILRFPRFWAVSSKMSLSSALIAIVALLIVVVVAVVVVVVVVVGILQAAFLQSMVRWQPLVKLLHLGGQGPS
ncbi:hypothetical protein Tco_0992983 [Tanacetum coccineum]|uniref:Uncharacterized protein n=1 Tax=Tanacetum coccineum TaxID=301880 RepID=A0ABQ5F457_9ASTR